MTRRTLLLWIVLFVSVAAAQGDHSAALLVTSDTEGHVAACAACPKQTGRGGLDRRATAVARERQGDQPVLLLDAGNWLAGPESLGSGGAVMVAAYNLLKYDAVNISPKDLYWGREQTLKLLKDAKFATVSATLLDAQTGQPLFSPYVVLAGRGRTAVIGLCELPAGHGALPHVQQQLAGIRLRPVAEALDEQLPKAKADSDRVIVLYHGPGRGLRDLQKKLAGTGVLIAAAGVSRENVPDDPAAPTIMSHRDGQTIAKTPLAGGNAAIEQFALTGDIPGDPAMQKLIADYALPRASLPEPANPPAAAATAAPGVAAPPPAASTRPAETAVESTVERPAVAVPPAIPPPATKPAAARVAARQPHEPKGLAGVGLTQEQVNKSIERGCNALWRIVQTQAKTQDGKLGGAYEGFHTLAAMALVKCGFHQRDEAFDQRLREYLASVQPEYLGTYAAGTLCMLVEAYADPQFEPVQRRAARCLLESQGPKGWDYLYRVPESALQDPRMMKPLQVWGGRRPVGSGETERWTRATTQPGREIEGDNSLAQYAVMGLQSAARTGVEVPPQTWQQVIDLYRSRQNADGGWAYVGAPANSYGSMTCAGAYGISVARYDLGEKQPAVDESVERALAWLAERFTVERNPGAAYHYYYLYSLERLGRTLDTEFIGPHEWYPLGAKYLLGVQKPDGSWHEAEPDPHIEATTAFALLFLSRGTPPLVAAKKEGPGMLRTAIVQPPAPRLYVILDCSGSMHAEISGQPKFDAARKAVTRLLAELPDTTAVALRVYGHRKRATEDGASEDTELLQPLSPIDRDAIADRLQQLRARGKTPLARSLREAATELTRGETVDVILLTDGGEDTQPRQDPVAAAQLLGTRKGVTLHIIGFDIGDPDWGKQLRDMARVSKGRYWPAQDGETLLRELRAAVLRTPGEFSITDPSGKTVAKGTFGDSAQLPDGQYSFVTTFSGKSFKESFWINPGQKTAVFFDAGKFEIAAPEAAMETPPADRPKFCSTCGNPLAAAGKFCTACGAKISP